MTSKELKETIVKLGYADWAKEKSASVNYPLIGFVQEIKGLTAVYEFLTQQVDGFAKYENAPQEIKNIASDFNRLKLEIDTMVNSGNLTDNSWNVNIRNDINRDNPPKLLYNSPETKFLMETHISLPQYFQPAYFYITQQSLNNVADKTWFTGYILAYEFKNKLISEIAKRKNAEQKGLDAIRSDFEKYLSDSEQHLVSYLDRSKKEVANKSEEISDFVDERKKMYDGWFDKISSEFYAFDLASSEKMKEWEKVYREKLKLEAPAQYWNQRAKKLRKEGWGWLIGLILSSAVAVGVLIWVLNEIALGTLGKIFADSGTAVKWSVIMITLVSFLAFLIRTFSKLTFSSFHLVRDAEEREQLTFVYLAMQKENKIDPTERHLIMQSLFSRADSGLLKDDGGPTMPGNIIDQAMKNR